MIRSRVFLTVLIVLPAVVYGIFYFSQEYNSQTNFSFNELTIVPFSDSIQGGNSSCRLENIEDLQFSSMMREAAPFPFAGISLFHSDRNLFHLLNKKIALTVSSTENQILPVQLSVYVTGYSRWEDSTCLITLEHLLNITRFQTEYITPISDFEIPQWWLAQHRLKASDLTSYDLNQVMRISFLSSPYQQLNKECRVHISQMTFLSDFTIFNKQFFGGVAFYYFFLIFIWVRQKQSRKKVYVPIYPLKNLEAFMPIEKVKKVVGTHFHHAELTIEMVATQSGVPAYKIATLFKEEMNMNFKKYLNLVRTEEAKRLLIDTEKRISEIAYDVGYNHVQNFNRVFKEMTQLSPTEFRGAKHTA